MVQVCVCYLKKYKIITIFSPYVMFSTVLNWHTCMTRACDLLMSKLITTHAPDFPLNRRLISSISTASFFILFFFLLSSPSPPTRNPSCLPSNISVWAAMGSGYSPGHRFPRASSLRFHTSLINPKAYIPPVSLFYLSPAASLLPLNVYIHMWILSFLLFFIYIKQLNDKTTYWKNECYK